MIEILDLFRPFGNNYSDLWELVWTCQRQTIRLRMVKPMESIAFQKMSFVVCVWMSHPVECPIGTSGVSD